jgi:hypothetical protein
MDVHGAKLGCTFMRPQREWNRVPPNRRCSRRRSYGTRKGTRCARVHGSIFCDPPQLKPVR